MSGAMSDGAGRELRDALVVWSDERAPYNLIIVIICVECGAEECDASFYAVMFPHPSPLPFPIFASV